MSDEMAVVFVRASEVFKKTDGPTVFDAVCKSLDSEHDAALVREQLARQGEDWSFLAHQVVGGEDSWFYCEHCGPCDVEQTIEVVSEQAGT